MTRKDGKTRACRAGRLLIFVRYGYSISFELIAVRLDVSRSQDFVVFCAPGLPIRICRTTSLGWLNAFLVVFFFTDVHYVQRLHAKVTFSLRYSLPASFSTHTASCLSRVSLVAVCLAWFEGKLGCP